jgi:Methyltransferase domain
MIAAPDPDNVGDYLISSRSFAEYEAMFMLRESDLGGRLLDCPGGASSFTADASVLGAVVTAVDPVYATPIPVLQELVQEESDRGSAHTAAGMDRYQWEFYGDLEGHREMRKQSAAVFARDIEEHPERYLAASLPELPFEDGQFDLVLSSHFLFTYADRLDQDFHHAALIELHRVSRREVRVFPLLDQAGHPLDDLIGAVLGRLSGQGIEARVLEVPYEFQRGGNEMLVMSAHPWRGARIADDAGA